MTDMQSLSAAHAAALQVFVGENRGYFAEAVGDRGDAYFEQFEQILSQRLVEQTVGTGAYYVLVEPDEPVVGRVNLALDGADREATLGYRLAQRVTGRGVATHAVAEVCIRAALLGVHRVAALVSDRNPASQRVLIKNGFVAAGAVQLPHGGPGVRYELLLQEAA